MGGGYARCAYTPGTSTDHEEIHVVAAHLMRSLRHTTGQLESELEFNNV
jgi:hypothetical protein